MNSLSAAGDCGCFPCQFPIESFGEKMVDTAYAWVLAPGSVSAALDLLGKVRGSLAPTLRQ